MFKYLLFIIFACASFLEAQPVANPALLAELNEMYAKDQAARWEIINTGKLESEEAEQIILKIEQENLPRLKMIIDEFGWPGFHLVGEEGTDKMWLLVQHCDRDLDFQKTCLDLLETSVAQEDAPKKHFAYLLDRVLVNEGKPQVYGTQVQFKEGKVHTQPIEDPDNLDKRREQMGLDPFAEYLTQLKKAYRIE